MLCRSPNHGQLWPIRSSIGITLPLAGTFRIPLPTSTSIFTASSVQRRDILKTIDGHSTLIEHAMIGWSESPLESCQAPPTVLSRCLRLLSCLFSNTSEQANEPYLVLFQDVVELQLQKPLRVLPERFTDGIHFEASARIPTAILIQP